LASFAGQKEMRYVSFAPPFLAVVWGLGLAQVCPALMDWLRSSRIRMRESVSTSFPIGEAASKIIAFVAVSLVVVANPFWLRTATVIGSVALPGEAPIVDWRAAQDVLRPWIAKSEIVITTEELGAIYFLGRSDIRYSPNKLREIRVDQRHEFGIDPRLGLPIISTPESLEKLMSCFVSGLMDCVSLNQFSGLQTRH
jgi:hypothetical protein